MKKLALFFICAIFFITSCQTPSKKPVASENAKRYPLKGKVISVDKVKQKATIDHEKIPDFMEAMTMSFPIYDNDVLGTLNKGDEIKAELIDNGDGDYWLENIVISAAPTANQPAPPINENFVQIDKEVPDFKFTNQDGKAFSLKDYRGKALAITFIYSRCPLPEYCILMSRRFSDLAIQLQNSAELKDKVRLLSISFDPATDTPETLKKYGIAYIKNPDYDFSVWQLATAPDKEIHEIANFFGLRYEVDQNNKMLFNHALLTFAISPDGKVKKVLPGGDWTNEELLRALETTLK